MQEAVQGLWVPLHAKHEGDALLFGFQDVKCDQAVGFAVRNRRYLENLLLFCDLERHLPLKLQTLSDDMYRTGTKFIIQTVIIHLR